MKLFQNRAGLKKAYADLQEELHLLTDRLKQQEGATIRIKEQMEALGELLGEPESGFSALVYFQLRALWRSCHHQIARFATDIARQQELREASKHQESFVADHRARLEEVTQRLDAAAAEADLRRERLNAAQREVERLTAFWHYFERRRRLKALEPLRAHVALADGEVGIVHAERSAIEREPLPPFPGLSLTARRNINLAIVAYAELLCELVAGFDLTIRAKEAQVRRVHDMDFGDRSECEAYMQRIQLASVRVQGQNPLLAGLRDHMERLRKHCKFRNASDTVPTADSLEAARAEGTVTAAYPWNVLAEDYWDLYTLLLR